MKNVLFVGVTNYDFRKTAPLHLEKKFLGLSKEIKPYALSKGKPFYKKIWHTEFYLLPPAFFWLLSFWIASWLCLTKKIDVIVAQSPLIEGFLGVILKKMFKKELIVEIHGDWKEGPFLSKKRKLAFIERKFTPLLAKISFEVADKIRGVSNNLIKEAKEISPHKRYFLFPTFTDLDDFLAEKETKFDDFILFVGHIQKVKGLRYLIGAFNEIKGSFPGFKLTIIGEEREMEGIGGGERIEFKGRLSLTETRNIMRNCYCLVLPSLSEGLPRVLMEAMALGKPVIGSNVGGIPELIKNGQNGFLFEAGNVAELAGKLRILLSDKNLATEMGKRGRKFVKENFSNEKYIRNYISMIYA